MTVDDAGTHTPGPWEVLEPVGTWIQTAGDPYGHGRMHIADVRGWGHLTGFGACHLGMEKAVAVQAANARLIAAAPDLLAACKNLMSMVDVPVPADTPSPLIAIRAAILKAEAR